MQVTYEYLFDRIEANPVEHLGGYSPWLLHSYFLGYEHAWSFHGKLRIDGRLSLRQFNDWFCAHAYGGPQGFASFCVLLTASEEKALELFFEFRSLALNSDESMRPWPDLQWDMSMGDFILDEAMRTRTAMYLGGHAWMAGMWAMWNGYLWAEKDLGIDNSDDRRKFEEFQGWIDERCPFAKGQNWGKLFDFLGMGGNEKAREEFYDVFELFVEGEPPDAQTKRCREWIAGVIADVKERQEKGEL